MLANVQSGQWVDIMDHWSIISTHWPLCTLANMDQVYLKMNDVEEVLLGGDGN